LAGGWFDLARDRIDDKPLSIGTETTASTGGPWLGWHITWAISVRRITEGCIRLCQKFHCDRIDGGAHTVEYRPVKTVGTRTGCGNGGIRIGRVGDREPRRQ